MVLLPGWKDLDLIQPRLEEAERKVLKVYDRIQEEQEELGVDFRVYAQPFLENRRADVVVCRPESGILILEVKHWTPGLKRGSGPGESACRQLGSYRAALLELGWFEVEDLLEAESFTGDYEVLRQAIRRRISCALIVDGIVTDQIQSEAGKAARRFGVGHVLGGEALAAESGLPLPRAPEEDWNSELEERAWRAFCKRAVSWLTPPFHRWEQRPAVLTASQKRHASPRGAGYYRIRGPAGSGKTLLLAHRAAALAAQGKKVLMCCFNITLTCYLRDQLKKVPYQFSWSTLEIRHYHGVLKEIRELFGRKLTPDEGEALSSGKSPELSTTIALQLLQEKIPPELRFEGIFIDEGQDLNEGWFQVLIKLLEPKGELLICRDNHQNIFSHDNSWLDKKMKGFQGPWVKLGYTYRMEEPIVRASSCFAHEYLKSPEFSQDPERDSEQLKMFGRVFCRWHNVPADRHIELAVSAVKRIIAEEKTLDATHPSDIAVITFGDSTAFDLVHALRREGLRPLHFFGRDGKPIQTRKLHFYRGDGRIKVTTIQNYRGFEVSSAIVCIPPAKGSQDERARGIYSAISRAVRGVLVLNGDERFDQAAQLINQ